MAAKNKLAYVLRFSDALLPPGKSTIVEHNKVFLSKGKVWFGKMGSSIKASTLELVSQSSDMHLILMKPFGGRRQKTKILAYISKVCAATATLPPRILIPEYYRNSTRVSAWFCLSGAFYGIDHKELMAWIVQSSGKAILDSMSRGTTSFFVAIRKPGKVIMNDEPCLFVEETYGSFDNEAHKDDDDVSIESRNSNNDLERLLSEYNL